MNDFINNLNGKILVSSCLLGLKTRYDGKTQKSLIDLIKKKDILFFCPEQGGGLATPRKPAEIEVGKTAKDVILGNGKIINSAGEDVTKEFLKGAFETLNICKIFLVKYAILKSKSPSCGYKKVYDGTFKGNLIDGNGITTELLEQNGIKIFTENDFF
ncbi:MAG: DUF523 domain-containing protein [Candidatus Gracilibacteria bacterium]|nr:DUF523 domain-containing protein [Candidatus Gracilibacteria bacterium]